MKKVQLLKRIFFLAVSLTIVYTWQKQWLADEDEDDFANDRRFPSDDGHLALKLKTHLDGRYKTPVTQRLPMKRDAAADDINGKDGYGKGGVSSKKRNSQATRKPRKKSYNSSIRIYDGREKEKSATIEALDVRNPVNPSLGYESDGVRRQNTEQSRPRKAENGVRGHDDDDEESNKDFVKFMSQKNFQRHRDDDVNRGNEFDGDVAEKTALPTTTFPTKSRNLSESADDGNSDPRVRRRPSTRQPSWNANRALITKDMDAFVGDVPLNPDYDLPLIKDAALPSKVGARPSKKRNEPARISKEPTSQVARTANENEIVDEAMDGVVILGKINATRKYAVFSTTTEGRAALSYVFYVPLTVLAWKRIGFESVVIVVGSKADWDSDPLLYHVLSSARRLDCVVVFLEPRAEKSVMISQVARIFVPNVLRSAFPGIDDVYMVTSDADIWPIYGDAYALPPGRDILSLNSDCCQPFSHRGVTYRMLPMANVGMKVRTWREMTRKFGVSPKTVDDVLTYFIQEFGVVALKPVQKGDNVGWFLDQMMISILVAKWTQDRGPTTVKYSPRNVGLDRIDRGGWNVGDGIGDKIDVHLLLEAYIPGVWVRITRLLEALYGHESERYVWCREYYENFQQVFLEKYRNSNNGLQ